MLIDYVFVLPFCLILATALFSGACNICRVQTPGFWPSMGIAGLAWFPSGTVNSGVEFILAFTAGDLAEMKGFDWDWVQVSVLEMVASLISLPISMVVCAGIYAVLLKSVTFGKGIL